MMKSANNQFLIAWMVTAFVLPSFCQSSCFDRAMQLFYQHHWAKASSAFAACEREEPGKTSASLYEGKALVNLAKFEEAAVALESFRATHAQSEDAVNLLAYIRFRQNKPKESLQLFAEAASLRPPTADDLKLIALDYVLLSDYDRAGHYLEESLAEDPTSVEARYHLGRVRYQQNRFDLAIAAFQEVLRRDPGNIKAEDNLGLSLEAKNEVDSAVVAYRTAIKLDDALPLHSEQPYLNLGTLLVKSGQTEEAVPLLTRACAIAPSSSKAHYQLAKAYFDLTRFEDARLEAETTIRLDPNESSNHYLLGRIYQRSGEVELAKEQFHLTEALIRSKSSSSGGMASDIR
jgi:tetratricopeptide (TPR) repeat protein